MKTLIALAVLLNMSSVSAQVAHPKFYAAKWKIANVSPMCPTTIPTGAVCFGLGSIVTVKAKIGCADQVISKHFVVTGNNVIEAHSVIESVPFAMCAGDRTIRETVIVHNPGPVTLENIILE